MTDATRKGGSERTRAQPSGTSIDARWQTAVFLAPAVIIYTAFSIFPLLDTIRLSLYRRTEGGASEFVGLSNYDRLFSAPALWDPFSNAFMNNVIFFVLHLLIEIPVALLLAALLSRTVLAGRATYRSLIFLPTVLSVVIIGFTWQLILNPLWGVAESFFSVLGFSGISTAWLGRESSALVAVTLISIWQWIGMPMILLYAALQSIPDDILDAAIVDGANQFWTFIYVKLPLVAPTIALIGILTFVGNFNAFDLVFAMKGALAGPNFATDILGTFFYRTFFGFQMQAGDPNLGATVATVIFGIILLGVGVYLFLLQTRLRRYSLS